MYPWLLPEVFGYTFAMYDILLGIGIIAMLFFVVNRLEKVNGYSRSETNRLVILLIISLLFALFFSWFFDGIFHSIKEGELAFGSITFLGGLIGGVASFLLLFKYFYHGNKKDVRTVMSTVIVGVVLAHAFGRIGCFFAGCCFGVPTDSMFGVLFPHGHAHDVFPLEEVYPTQLFEAAFLFTLFFVMNKVEYIKNKEIETYLIGYGIWRILIEFIRGDDRGSLFTLFTTKYNVFPTPSQFISVLMIAFGIYMVLHLNKKDRTKMSN